MTDLNLEDARDSVSNYLKAVSESSADFDIDTLEGLLTRLEDAECMSESQLIDCE